MEFSKNDTRILKGIAILLMVLLHLFAVKDVNGLYETFPLINEVPLVYYFAIMGDACRPIYMFVTGYAFYIICSRTNESIFKKNVKRIMKLYINFWVVFLIFIPLGFLFGSQNIFKWDIQRLLMDFFGLHNYHNGAWWFMQVYIIFVLISPLLIYVIKRVHTLPLVLVSGGIFLICHLQRYRPFIDPSNELTSYMLNLGALLGTSLLSFIVGACFSKDKLFSRIYAYLGGIRFKNVLGLIVLGLLVIFHSITESSVIAPFNAVIMICVFMLMNKGERVERFFEYLSQHSTNIWLTHMFFYETIFTQLTFAPKYPILIYPWLILMCIGASYVIKFVTVPLQRLVDERPKLIEFKQKNAEM